MNQLSKDGMAASDRIASMPGGILLVDALELLYRAYQYAHDLGADVWEFAVEVDEFRRARVTTSELRWLLFQGFAMHADEMTVRRLGKRQFRAFSSSAISNNSCFVLTEAGAALFEGSDATSMQTASDVAELRCGRAKILRRNDHDEITAAGRIGLPRWDGNRCELSFNGQVVKRFRSPAPNQYIILQAFESLSWPVRVDDPLPLAVDQCPKRRLHDAIRRLNRSQGKVKLRFCGDGSGRGVLWESSD